MLNDVSKAKRWVWIEFSIAIILLATSGFFTFLYYGANDSSIWKEGLISDKDQKIAELKNQIETLTLEKDELSSTAEGEKGSLEEQNLALKTENDSLKTSMAAAAAYNNFFEHMNAVIETHNGFTGWTDTEFQAGNTIAATTGDTSFVNLINWAWYETSVSATERVITVWKAIENGIESSLQ